MSKDMLSDMEDLGGNRLLEENSSRFVTAVDPLTEEGVKPIHFLLTTQ
jgi:hypothetical protein